MREATVAFSKCRDYARMETKSVAFICVIRSVESRAYRKLKERKESDWALGVSRVMNALNEARALT